MNGIGSTLNPLRWNCGRDGDDSQVDRTGQGDARQNRVDVFGGALARTDTRDEAVVSRMFSATSSGLKMIAV